MKTVTSADRAPTLAADPPVPSQKVSFHVVWEARNDVRVMRAASTLVGEGYEVSIVDITADRSRPSEEYRDGIHFLHIIIPDWQTSRRSELLFFARAVKALFMSTARLLRDKADVYHTSDLNALLASCLAALIRRKPLVVEVYDLQFPFVETGIGFWRRASRLIALMHKLILPRCAAVIATSPLHAEAMRRHFHIARVSLLRNIPPYQRVPKSNRLREHLGLAPHVQIALYQGNLQPDRHLDTLVHAAPFLDPDIVIVLMGKAVGKTRSHLESLIREKNVEERVKIILPVPYKELLEWTASADIGITLFAQNSLNMQLCLPNKLFEYIMAGLPVLSAPMEAVKEIITLYDVGCVASSLTPADMARGINALLRDRVVLERMRENEMQAAQELCWEKESLQLVRLYKDIVVKLKEKRNVIGHKG